MTKRVRHDASPREVPRWAERESEAKRLKMASERRTEMEIPFRLRRDFPLQKTGLPMSGAPSEIRFREERINRSGTAGILPSSYNI